MFASMKGNTMEKLYTAEEVKEVLKVKMPTIRSWIYQKKLPVIRAGRSIRIRETVLTKIIEGGLEAVSESKSSS